MGHTFREAEARLTERGAALRVADFQYTVLIITHDSIRLYERAIAHRFGPWLLLWTEHQGYHVEHEDEIVRFRMFDLGVPLSSLTEIQ